MMKWEKDFRNGRGDLFIGCLYLMEISVPLTSLRAALKHLRMDKTCLYQINILTLSFVYLTVRVLAFPVLYLLHASQRNLEICQLFTTLPLHCHLGTLAIVLFQSFWLSRLCQESKSILISLFWRNSCSTNGFIENKKYA